MSTRKRLSLGFNELRSVNKEPQIYSWLLNFFSRSATMFQNFLIGHLSFRNKAKAEAFYREMLWRYALRATVNPEDDRALRALFEFHPQRESKLGGYGVAHFEVHPYQYGTRCFFLARSDGKKLDFSYLKCISEAARSIP
jgi:hypothetical protein